MPLTVTKLHTKDQTAREMYRLVDRYAGDLNAINAGGAPLSAASLPAYYAAIRAIPYREDTRGVEVVTRPYIMLTAPGRGWDCKKKAIAIASWLKLHGIRYRFAAVSNRPNGEIHHVIVQAQIDNEWVDIDATYPRNRLFQREAWTNVEPLSGEGRPSRAPVLVSMAGDGAPGPALTAEYVATVRRAYPQYMGEAGTAAGAIVAIVVAVISAAATVTGVIVNAVQERKDREARERVELANVQSWESVQQAAIAAQSDAADLVAERQAEQYAMIKKWILPAGIAAGALLLLR